MEKKRAHLRDLFQTGKLVTVDFTVDDELFEAEIWMRKPLPAQQEEALNKSRGQQVRRKRLLKDPASDEYLTLAGDVESIDSRDELLDAILIYDKAKLNQIAFNEVLYDPNFAPTNNTGELVYGAEGQAYLELLEAVGNRVDEIMRFNEELEDADSELEISLIDDEELVALRAQEQEFNDAVKARFDELEAQKRAEYKGVKIGSLRTTLAKKIIEGDVNMHWYAEYQKWMLFHACRDPEDHKKSYFRSPEDLAALPGSLLMRLQAELDHLDQGQEAIKNSLSPQLS